MNMKRYWISTSAAFTALLYLGGCLEPGSNDDSASVVVDGHGAKGGPFQSNIILVRNYSCGYALPNYGCDNGRNHALVTAVDMTAAIAACHAAQLPGYSDFCYVIDSDGATSTDVSECSAALASWRPGNNCCNFMGTLSCPAVCGDGTCNGSEDPWSCPADCGPPCGDGICNGSESQWSCPADCPPPCGDGICNGSEDQWSCPADCGPPCGPMFLCE